MDGPAADFDWEEGNREKCCAHGLSISDIEQILKHGETLIVPDVKHSLVEARLIAIGRTPSGRYAFVVFTPETRGEATILRPVSARSCTRRSLKNMKKKFPVLKTDEEAEAFLEQDLTEYLHAENFKPYRFEFMPKPKSINLRISEDLLNAVRERAKRQGIPYQRYIRQTLERAVTARKR